MLPDRSTALHVGLSLAVAIIVIGGVRIAQPVVVPLAFSFFIMCLAWPLQKLLTRSISNIFATLITTVAVIVIVVSFVFILVWSIGRIVSGFVSDADRIHSAYIVLSGILNKAGLTFADLSVRSFDFVSILGFARGIATWLNEMITVSAVVLVYVALGSLEIPEVGSILERRAGTGNKAAALALNTARQAARNIRRYMIVRSGMSILTGLVASSIAFGFGLKHAVEWGVAIFALNYIPFVGPFMGTVGLTLHALIQHHGYGDAIVIFLALNFTQFVLGSYMEPKISGHQLIISPFFILFSVFFGMFVWGIAGAFLGVPVAICLMSYLEGKRDSAAILELLRGRRAQGAGRWVA